MRTVYLLVVLCFSIYINAQSFHISGKVVDERTNAPLSYVNVWLEGSDIGSVTDNDGYFSLEHIPKGEYLLLVSALAYESESLRLSVHGNINDLSIKLKETSIELDQIMVTATRTERNLKSVPLPVQVLTGKAIGKMQVANMRDLLEYELPGVEFTNNGGYSNINMLGFGGKYVLFLVNGERMAGESFDNVDYDRIDMENIERVEIIKGASSSLYGSNAIGGIINIITKKPIKPLNLQAGARLGSNNEQNYNLSAGSKQRWGWVSLSGGYKTRDPYLIISRSPMVREYDNGEIEEKSIYDAYIAGHSGYNVSPKILFDLSRKLQLELKGEYFFKERHPGGMDGEKVRDYFYTYSGGAKAIYSLSNLQHISFSGHYDRSDKYDYYKILDEKEKKYENAQFNFNLIYDFLIAGKHSFVAGGEYFSDELMTFMFDNDGANGKRDARTYSAFVQQDWVLNDKITLVGGLRYDYHSQFKGHISPRLSAMYRPVDKITLRGGYAGGFRSPTLKELYTNWFHPYGGGFQIKGNEHLKPEVSNNINLSAEGIFGKTLITAMTQYSLMKNKIENIWINSDTTQYVNMGNPNVFSAEFSVSHKFNNTIQVKGSYAYVNDGLGKRSVVRPHTATIRADYTSCFFNKHNPVLSLSGKFFSSMGIYGIEGDEDTGLSNSTKEYKVYYDSYSNWRITLTQPLPYNFILNAGINNLFDYKPKFYSFYTSISSGRTFYVGLKWNLN